MSKVFPRLDILPAAQQAVWKDLKSAADLGFVLYGGTALALRLGHRTSIDFDFFSDAPLDQRALFAAIPFLRAATVLQDRPDTFTCLAYPDEHVKASVKVSFFGSINFGRVGNPEWTSDHVAQLASCNDLLATKLKVVPSANRLQDYLDVASMLKAGQSLAVGLGAARTLFGVAFQPSECLKALVYFEGGI